MDEQSICLSVCLSVCLYPLNVNMDMVETTLSKHFKTFRVHSEPELKDLLEKEPVFCIVIGGNIRETKDIIKVRKICLATSKIPCLMFGHTREQEFLFQLAKDGLDDFVTHGKIELLIEKLHQQKEQATFRIDLREFGIDLNQCKNYWTKKCLKFIISDFNFLKFNKVNELTKQLCVSREYLSRIVNDDCPISLKQLLISLKNYYAIYLLQMRPTLSCKDAAQQCGFSQVDAFHKSFYHIPGYTVNTYRQRNRWHDFPAISLKNKNKLPEKQTKS